MALALAIVLPSSNLLMDFQAESMLGRHPLLMASIQELASSMKVSPVSLVLFIFLALTFLMIFCLSTWVCCRNQGLRAELGSVFSCCRSDSLSTGVTRVKQSLSRKKCLIILLILFLFSTASEIPFWISSAYYKYYLGSMGQPSESARRRVKSRTIHMKVGNSSSILSLPLFLACSSLARFVMTFRLFRDFSSMLPTELQMKYEDSSRANSRMRLLQASVSSMAPKPSESITSTSMSGASGCSDLITCLLIHSPFVHELMVGHTRNECLFSSTLFRNRLLPVRYLPTMVMTPRGPSSFLMNSMASSVILNFSPSNLMRGMGWAWGYASKGSINSNIKIKQRISTRPMQIVLQLYDAQAQASGRVHGQVRQWERGQRDHIRQDPQQEDPLGGSL